MKRFLIVFLGLYSIAFAQDLPKYVNYHHEMAAAKAQQFARMQSLEKSATATDYGSYDVHFYELNLTFDRATSTISGTVTMYATSTADSQNSVQIDLSNTGLTVNDVSGRPYRWTHSNNKIRLYFSPALANGEDFSVTVDYQGSPVGAGFQGLTFDTHGNNEPIISSLSEPYFARSWWPCKDVPSDKADSANINITSEDDLIPVSNGTLVNTVDNGNGTHTYFWQVRYPITTYLISVAISDYTHLHDTYTAMNGDTMRLDYFLYPEQASNSYYTNNVYQTNQMIQIFAHRYGEYPFIQEKYGMASFDWGGAMEHQTISSMGAYAPSIIAHELSHQWWGDMVTCKTWQHIWLNEGFASYSEAIYYEAIAGESRYHNVMASMAYRGAGTVFVQDTTYWPNIFDDNLVYNKGAWVLHMLRHVVGDSTFFDILAAYRNQYYMSTATTEDFRDVSEAVSGINLHPFFHQWIYESGVPNYDYCLWTNQTTTGYTTNVCVDQTQVPREGPLFVMPIDIYLSNDAGDDTTIVVQNDVKDTVYTFAMDWRPTSIALDPDQWILKTATQVPANLERTGCEFLTDFVLAPNYPNPFNPGTHLAFTIPVGAHVTGTIYNVKGQRVATLVDEYKLPAQYSLYWNGTNDQGEMVSSGIYFFQLKSGAQIRTQKLMLIR